MTLAIRNAYIFDSASDTQVKADLAIERGKIVKAL